MSDGHDGAATLYRRWFPKSVRRRLRPLATRLRSVETDLSLRKAFNMPQRAFREYRGELLDSGLFESIERRKGAYVSKFGGTSTRGYPCVFGELLPDVGLRLYAVIRHVQPDVVVETGVCNGASTSVILSALHRSGRGILHSIDYPEVIGQDVDPAAFWAGKGGSAIPPGEAPGWLVPERLRDRWTLHVGRSQELLLPLLSRLKEIDAFFHDSEHSYACMSFEFDAAYSHLRKGGVLAADDINANDAFTQLVERTGGTPIPLGRNQAAIIR